MKNKLFVLAAASTIALTGCGILPFDVPGLESVPFKERPQTAAELQEIVDYIAGKSDFANVHQVHLSDIHLGLHLWNDDGTLTQYASYTWDEEYIAGLSIDEPGKPISDTDAQVAVMPIAELDLADKFDAAQAARSGCEGSIIDWSRELNGEILVQAECGFPNEVPVYSSLGGEDVPLFAPAETREGAEGVWGMMQRVAPEYSEIQLQDGFWKFRTMADSVVLADGSTCLWELVVSEGGTRTGCDETSTPEDAQWMFSPDELTASVPDMLVNMHAFANQYGGLFWGEITIGYFEVYGDDTVYLGYSGMTNDYQPINFDHTGAGVGTK